ncbi:MULTISPECIES: type II toxin-antitoxin system RelE family toxin [unclassified Sphingobium]|uniref:type II toxin-antitoxin system RelE family toxin n=1 Tax=unclassified Sphingobium TaxID=2611147 RepID=UPI000D15DB5B|nr:MULTISPECIES: type II toxin-antitoxin system RelE/ParE family toxin [unclassified Sphingobium]MBG6117418.1 mRNA interferase RelE/StbE [Sphingobium sp. JAI105]PSO12496.1 addiction module toxin RelE [Sphingobium sp. AEW4]
MDIRFSKTAMKALLRSNKRTLIRQKIEELAQDPDSLAANMKRLQGRPEYRLRVQDWRVIFRIEQNILWIDDIAPRGSAYEVNP